MNAPSPDPRDRLGAFQRMRRIATGVLVVMALLFAVSTALRSAWPPLAWVQAFAEAGLAGGLADWFAVTALFRRPMGLPIPHTAIIPANRERIGRALGDFIGGQLLSPALVEKALARFDAAALLPDLVAAVPRADLEHSVEGLVRAGLDELAVAPAAGAVLRTVWTPERSAALAGQAVNAVADALAARRDALRDELVAQGASWTPRWFDRMLADRVLGAVEGLLTDLKAADHPWRLELDRVVTDFAARLGEDPALAAQAEGLKRELLEGDAIPALSSRIADGLAALRLDAEGGAALNTAVRRTLAERILAERPTVSRLVSERLADWDPAELVAEIELQAGRDLQYIRINGALVGSVVGLAIHAVRTALGAP